MRPHVARQNQQIHALKIVFLILFFRVVIKVPSIAAIALEDFIVTSYALQCSARNDTRTKYANFFSIVLE